MADGIGKKVDYVTEQMKDKTPHHCHWPGCGEQVPPALWGCRRHWYKLPKELRAAIWSAYEPGQEKSKTPSMNYRIAARRVQDWIRKYLERGGKP